MAVWKLPLDYLILRLVRHFLPTPIVRFLLKRGWIIKPGLETQAPRRAVEQYVDILGAYGESFKNKRVLVFGYGGNFSVGVHILEQGASHVVLSDKFAIPNEENNRKLMDQFSKYLLMDGGKIKPHPSYITLLEGDILDVEGLEPVDIVLSNSVYEHLPSNLIAVITQKLAALTTPGGVHLHNIDLRDHYFKYPFEMLAYSSATWKRWLNPTSNLNRLRYKDYEAVFAMCFEQVENIVIESDEVNFERSYSRIRSEFLTGDNEIDAVTQIRIIATRPMLGM